VQKISSLQVALKVPVAHCPRIKVASTIKTEEINQIVDLLMLAAAITDDMREQQHTIFKARQLQLNLFLYGNSKTLLHALLRICRMPVPMAAGDERRIDCGFRFR
jgi:hypothetical protein